MSEPLICSAGGIPYNKPHLDAKDAEIERLRARVAQLEQHLAAARPLIDLAHDVGDVDDILAATELIAEIDAILKPSS